MKQKTVLWLVVFILGYLSGCKPVPVSLGGLVTIYSMGYSPNTEYFVTHKVPFFTPVIQLLSGTGHFKMISDKSLGPSGAPIFYRLNAGTGTSPDNSEISLVFIFKFDNQYQRIVECSGEITRQVSGVKLTQKLNKQNIVDLICLLYENKDVGLKQIIDHYFQQLQTPSKEGKQCVEEKQINLKF